jgi:catechol 2,3-dioxygenase-like lactoylglutathione lyase family enzyme
VEVYLKTPDPSICDARRSANSATLERVARPGPARALDRGGQVGAFAAGRVVSARRSPGRTAKSRLILGDAGQWSRPRCAMIDHLDHLVLTTRDPERCIDFYTRVLGMRVETFGAQRVAFRFGDQKINLHVSGKEFEPKADRPTPGSLDLCFIASIPLAEVTKRLSDAGVPIIEGPVRRTGAAYPITSVYVRDPDLNLIEIAERADDR